MTKGLCGRSWRRLRILSLEAEYKKLEIKKLKIMDKVAYKIETIAAIIAIGLVVTMFIYRYIF